MNESRALLEEYATNGSEAAFREIVSRYLDFVYSTALRLVHGNIPLAEDVTQMVFISLARQARSLSRAVMLGGWLHQRAFHLATKAVRSERRRQIREREAVAMNNLHGDSNAQWREVAPILDKAITQLAPADRTAILLRFFERRDFRSVAQALGSHEDAARMRVNRAVEKLHALLKARGATLSTTTLASILAAQTVVAAPPALAVATVSAALASASTATATTVLNLITMTKLKTGLTTALVLALATTAVVQHRSRAGLRRENQLLREQVAQLNTDNERLGRNARRSRVPLLPAPVLATASPTAALPAEIGQPASLYARVTNGAKLTAAQLESYLEANQRSAASLLAGFRTSGDAALLAEAMQRFPEDPQVAFEAAFRKDISAEERRQWLDRFKQSAEKNALPYYLSASEHFKAGQVDKAVEDMIAASDRRQFQDYSLDRIQADDEAYRAAGYSVAEARLAAVAQLLLPQLLQVRDLSHHMVQLADSYRQAGDESSRLAALEMVAELGRRYSDGGPGEILISQLVGIHAERLALTGMDPNASYAEGQTVQRRLDELNREREAVRELSAQADHLFPAMSEQDWITYQTRSTMFGEQAALRWLITRHAQTAR